MENKKIILTAADAEILENMVLYYDRIGVENLLNRRPEFVGDDLEKVLKILEKVLEV